MTASYGYKPNCTFTITQIVGDKFRGSFVARGELPFEILSLDMDDLESINNESALPEYEIE